MNIVLTYSLGRLVGLAEALYEEGFDVEHTPLIETKVLSSSEIKTKAAELLNAQWILFSSQAAIDACQALGLDFTADTFPKIGVVGKKTADKLTELGVTATVIAEPQNAAGLANCFTAHPEACSPVGLPQGNLALDTLQNKLESLGFETLPVTLYETAPLNWRASHADVVVMASPSAVRAVPDRIINSAKFVSLGETTQAALKKRGIRSFVAEAPTVDAVIDAIEQASS